jgi:hypothetical protein
VLIVEVTLKRGRVDPLLKAHENVWMNGGKTPYIIDLVARWR